jgi:hypothetical protein
MFYFAIILWVAMLVLAGMAFLAARNRAGYAGGAVLCAVLGIVAFAWSGVHSVPSKSSGLQISK